jgi:DNA mismatch repair protein MutL
MKKAVSEREKINKQNWEMLFEHRQEDDINGDMPLSQSSLPLDTANAVSGIFQFAGRYIITTTSSGIMLVDQKRAHERVLFDRFMAQMESGASPSQQELFPQQITLPLSDAEIIRELKPELLLLGFNINDLGKNTFVITGIPVGTLNKDIKELLEKILDNYKKNLLDLNHDLRANLAKAMAVNLSMKPDKVMLAEEMEALISQLFSSSIPETSPSGKKIIRVIEQDDIEKLFK